MTGARLFYRLRDMLSRKLMRNGPLENADFPAPANPVYVVGDIHGCANELDRLLEAIRSDRHANPFDQADIVFIGDYVDRGPNVERVLRRLMAEDAGSDRVCCLMGNHEDMMLGFLSSNGLREQNWLRNGGIATLESFGMTVPGRLRSETDFLSLAANARNTIPTDILDWLSARPLYWKSGDLIAVHAAMDPDHPVETQNRHLLLWGRDPSFLKSTRTDGPWVVHGHTITESPHVGGRRIPTDTGAFATGILTAAVIIPGQAVRYIQTGPT